GLKPRALQDGSYRIDMQDMFIASRSLVHMRRAGKMLYQAQCIVNNEVPDCLSLRAQERLHKLSRDIDSLGNVYAFHTSGNGATPEQPRPLHFVPLAAKVICPGTGKTAYIFYPPRARDMHMTPMT